MTAPKNSKYFSVFLSHSSKDVEFVNKLAERFEQLKIKYWLDNHELKIGDSLFTEIGSGISEADYVAVVLSNNSINSEWVKIELQYAQGREVKEKRVVVLPILLDEVPIPHFLNYKVHADFTSPDKFETSFERLLKTLSKDVDEDEDSEKFYPKNFIPDLKFFVGRTQLLENLKTQLSSTHRASIHDISGLGKTFSTYKFADKNQNDYEKIFFVRAAKEEMLQNLAEIGVWLNPSLKDVPDQSKQALGFKNWLEENENWLVIYDNVDEPIKLKPFVPLSKNGDCIFTSNFSLITRLGDEVTIEKLDKTDAELLLFSRANNKPQSEIKFEDAKEQKAFENIVKEIDGLPVSLNTTGAFINENTISFAEFERKMQRIPEILVKNEDGFDDYKNKSALKAFSIAIDDIAIAKPKDEFDNSPELAQKLLFAAGFIAPDNIPEILLKVILSVITEIDFESEENEDLWLEIRKKLLEYDLLKYKNEIFRTHRLIQKVIQTKPSVDEQKTIISAILRAIDNLFPWSNYGNWEECDLYLPHSVSAIKFAETLNLSSEEIARNYAKIGYHSRSRIQYQLAIEYLSKAINEYQKLFGGEDTKLAACLTELANVYKSQGKYDEAIELYKQGLEIDEKTIGKEHPDYAARLNNLAIVYKSQGKYNDAIELYKQVLEIDEKAIGKEHPDYVTCLNNLANVHFSQGEFELAEKYYQQVKELRERILGKNHPDTALIYWWIGELRVKQGNNKEALDFYLEALKIFEETLPEDHPNIAQLRVSVARCQERLENE